MVVVVEDKIEILKHVVCFRYYMFQYFNPALYNNKKKHKFNFIHALKNFVTDLYFVNNQVLNNHVNGF